MPSLLRNQTTFDVPAQATYQTSPTLPLAKKPRMTLTATYYVASTARSKLGREAGRADHNLRRLVGHANLLDSLMVELADAEREQEAWFHNSVSKATKPESEPKHIQWLDEIAEEEDDAEDDASDASSESSDSDIYDEDAEMFSIPPRSPFRYNVSTIEVDEDDEDELAIESDDEMDFDFESSSEELSLSRVASHSPPALTHDDSESDEDDMPASPEASMFDAADELSAKQRQTAFFDAKTQTSASLEELMIHQSQQPQQGPLIAVC